MARRWPMGRWSSRQGCGQSGPPAPQERPQPCSPCCWNKAQGVTSPVPVSLGLEPGKGSALAPQLHPKSQGLFLHPSQQVSLCLPLWAESNSWGLSGDQAETLEVPA